MNVKNVYVSLKSANTNCAPTTKIKSGPHAGRVDLNALREAQQ